MGFFDIFSDRNEKSAMKAQRAGIDAGRTAAFGALDTGLAGARAELDPYARRYETGSAAYSDALGLGGSEGVDRSRSMFRASPGYEFTRDEALQGALRSGSAMGALGSGNTYAALTDRASGLADTEYDDWLGRLDEFDTRGLATAGATSDMIYNTGGTKANVGWQAETGKGAAKANYELGKDQTGLNIFSAITGGLKLAAPFLAGPAGSLFAGGAGKALNASGYRGLT